MKKPIIDPGDRTATIAAIKQLAADDLRFLNAAIVDQLKDLRAASYAQNMAQFSVDDRVVFTDKAGERRSATVLKLNKKTVGVVTDDEEHWKVAPQLLELEIPPENNNVFDIVPGGRPNIDDDLQQDLPFDQGNRREWVGGFVASPGTVIGEGDEYKPDILAWMDAHQQVVGMAITKPGEFEDELIESLRNAISAPMAGTAGAPDSIRLAEATLIAPLKAAFPDIDFFQAPTPELKALEESMLKSIPAGSEQAVSYLDSGADPAAVGEMFKAAAGLFRAAPWNSIPHDQCLIGISIPSLGIEDGVVSIVGKMQQNYGFLFFSTLVEHEHYLLASDCLQRGLEADMPSYIALTYEAGADIQPALRKEIAGHGWEVADTSAYPELFIADVARSIRPMSPRDITLITLLCGTLPELFETVGDTRRAWLSDARPNHFPCFITLADKVDGVRFTVPYPYQQVLHTDRTSSALIARLLVLGRSSDDIDLDVMQPLATDLEDGFRQSPESGALGETRLGISSVIVEFAAIYLNETIATLLPKGLEEILMDIFPRKVAVGADDAETCIKDARAFYQYLKREHGLIQADACLDLLTDKRVDALAEALADDAESGFAKKMLEIGKAMGYDTDTPEGVDALVQAVNRGDVPAFDGLSLAGMPMPEPPATRVKPVDRKARKNKRKTSRRARKKNR